MKVMSVEQWTQRAGARDGNGNQVLPNSPMAMCWCLAGWIVRVLDVDNDRCEQRIREASNYILTHYDKVRDHMGEAEAVATVVYFNDVFCSPGDYEKVRDVLENVQ